MKHAAHERARARRYTMQALYQWDLSGEQVSAIKAQFLEAEDFSRADTSYFNKTLRDVSDSIETIDKKLSEYINRPFEQLDPVERAILRIGIYELLSRSDIPYRVTINEAVALTKKFGAEQGHAFVNGVLDKAAQHLRPDEYAHKNRQANGL
ncbi:MAG: transcription antitermination factor NusB [Thiohalobacterales bacterium]